jgi:hypothetical protein
VMSWRSSGPSCPLHARRSHAPQCTACG